MEYENQTLYRLATNVPIFIFELQKQKEGRVSWGGRGETPF